MDDNKSKIDINEHIDHQRWLLEHGFINDLHKDNLFMYGSIVHKDVQAVELDVDVEKKRVSYDVYVDKTLLKKIDAYKKLSHSKSIIGLWRFKRMLKKEGNLNLHHLLSRFVKDYCGPRWSVSLNLKDIESYEEGFEEQDSSNDNDNKQPDG